MHIRRVNNTLCRILMHAFAFTELRLKARGGSFSAQPCCGRNFKWFRSVMSRTPYQCNVQPLKVAILVVLITCRFK